MTFYDKNKAPNSFSYIIHQRPHQTISAKIAPISWWDDRDLDFHNTFEIKK